MTNLSTGDELIKTVEGVTVPVLGGTQSGMVIVA